MTIEEIIEQMDILTTLFLIISGATLLFLYQLRKMHEEMTKEMKKTAKTSD